MSDIVIRNVDDVSCHVAPTSWAFTETHAEAIAANWARRLADQPRLFNGRVLLTSAEWESLEAGRRILHSTWFETDYSVFLAMRDLGYPDRSVRNGFAMAALQGSDGGFVLARMGEHTANPGKIYFACGTPDPDDVFGDRLDLEGSAIRELLEETGLSMEELTVAPGWTLVEAGPRTAYLKSVRVDMPAHALASEIERRLALQDDPELAGMHVVTSRADLKPERMPDFILGFLDHALPGS